MRRFSFSTGNAWPTKSGEGVAWDDGLIAYRATNNFSQTGKVRTGQVDDISDQWGGQEGYSFTWVDEHGTPYALGFVNLSVSKTGLQVTVAFTAQPGWDFSVNWGDTNTTDGTTSSGVNTFQHTYAAAGDYTIAGTLTDTPDTSTLSVEVTVA